MSSDKATKIAAKVAVLRVVLYVRVSTDEQAGNYSLSTQLEACRKYAQDHGFVVVGEFSDDYSGATPIEARPEGRKAFAMLKSGEADCLVAYSMDRIVRPPEDGDEWDTPLLIRGLARLGKELHTVDRGQLKTDFANLLVATLDAKSAGEERRKIRERTMRGRKAKAGNGRVVGSGIAPYGYRYVRVEMVNPKTGTAKLVTTGLEIAGDEAEVVRQMYKWYVEDLMSGHEIAKLLSEKRIPTPGELHGQPREKENGVWGTTIVYKVLASEVYAGTWRYGKLDHAVGKHAIRRSDADTSPVSVPPIVSRQTWELAQQRRAEGKNTSRRHLEFLLTGRIRCGCGHNMIGCSNGNGTLYYACGAINNRTVKTETDCKERRARQDVIEPLAWEHALQSKKSAAEFLTMLKEYQETQKRDTAPLAEQIAEVKSMLEITSHRIKRIAKMRSEATDDDEAEQYTSDLEAAKSNKVSQERKLAKLEAEYNWTDALTDDDILAVLEMREQDLQKLHGATFEERRRYLAKIDLRVVVKDRKAKIESKLPVPPRSVNLDTGVFVSTTS